jgi:hypothetical protein
LYEKVQFQKVMMHGLLKKCSGVFSAATSEIDKNRDLVNPTDLTNFLNR